MKSKLILFAIILSAFISGCSGQAAESTTSTAAPDNNTDYALIQVKTQSAYDEFRYVVDDLVGDEFIYNEQGQLEQVIADGEENAFEYLYEYYEDGSIKVAQRYENMDGTYEVQQELKFDENGNIYEQVNYSGGINRRAADHHFYTYDENGNMVKEEHFSDTGEIDFVKTYEYDAAGKLIESTYTEYGFPEHHSVFYYNDFGYPSTEIEHTLDGERTGLFLYSYEYDNTNTLVKVAKYEETNPTKIEQIMGSAQFPQFDVRNNDVGLRYKEEDAMYVEVFTFQYLKFTPLEEEILLAKKKAHIDISAWGYCYDGDLFDLFW